MATVGVYKARTHFAALVERVQTGEEITITKHGAPVAKVVPIASEAQRSARDIIAEMRKFATVTHYFRPGEQADCTTGGAEDPRC